jgi:hypothetical protein
MEGFSLVFFELFVVVCKLPIKCLRDDHDRLHSVESAAVQWRDNYNQYFIHGVPFEEKLWKKVTQRKLTSKQLLSIQNVDQRFVAIQHYGFEKLIDNLDKRQIDISEYGNELYETKFGDNNVKFILYPDIDNPNMKRISFVHPDLKSASDAMAWKHNCTEKEYKKMEVLKSWV